MFIFLQDWTTIWQLTFLWHSLLFMTMHVFRLFELQALSYSIQIIILFGLCDYDSIVINMFFEIVLFLYLIACISLLIYIHKQICLSIPALFVYFYFPINDSLLRSIELVLNYEILLYSTTLPVNIMVSSYTILIVSD